MTVKYRISSLLRNSPALPKGNLMKATRSAFLELKETQSFELLTVHPPFESKHVLPQAAQLSIRFSREIKRDAYP